MRWKERERETSKDRNKRKDRQKAGIKKKRLLQRPIKRLSLNP